ncbi:MAG: MBL fold metallo-hydrolase [Clostridia bacterium]|nr:MBL fold metallo-hydrolase [Clostridia bacterium]
MKITFLGTAAAEGMPALFCNCEYCKEARKRGGKNIRTRSQSLINNDLLIDFCADTYMHSIKSNIDLSKIDTLLVTHSHSDHFYPKGFESLQHSGKKITLIANENIKKILAETVISHEMSLDNFIIAEDYTPINLCKYTVTPMPAYHALEKEGEKAKIYLISDGNKTLLYAHDTGKIYDESLEFMRKNNIHINFCTLDCTAAFFEGFYLSSHMNFEYCSFTKNLLIDNGIADNTTVFYVNHFSHNARPLHEEMCIEGEKRGFGVSYDGLCVEF